MRGIAILPSVRWPLRRASREEARLLALRDGSPRPDGVFRPEAERKIRQGLIEGIGRHNAERSVMDDIAAEPEREFVALRSDSPSVLGAPPARVTAEVKTGQRPYADISDFQLAAYQNAAASELLAAGPAFEPGPSIAPVTEPLPVLPGNAKTPPPPPAALGAAPARRMAEVPDLAVLRDVRHGLARKQQAERGRAVHCRQEGTSLLRRPDEGARLAGAPHARALTRPSVRSPAVDDRQVGRPGAGTG